MKDGRISYVDGLKGIVMILMIYGHVALFVFHNESSQFNTVVDYARMPFFFFVSGLFAAKTYFTREVTGLCGYWCRSSSFSCCSVFCSTG